MADSLTAPRIARFKNGRWSPLGKAPSTTVFAFCDVYAWHHPRLFVGGAFTGVGDLTPEEVAALLAGNVDPTDYESLVARLVAFIAQAEDPAEAAYWEAVYEHLGR